MSTRFVRTRGGSVIHRSDCRTLKTAKTAVPWEWAEGKSIAEIRREAIWSHQCLTCWPYEEVES